MANHAEQPQKTPVMEETLRAVTIGELDLLTGPVQIVPYNPAWPELYWREEERIRAALGDRILLLEHVGSTSVPGLAAKPKVDILLAVADSADESAYLPNLEAIGYYLRIREPDWFEHRMLRHRDIELHLHVFSQDCPEIERVLLFRDRLRSNEAERMLYERTKRDLAQRPWTYMQEYAAAKGAVVEEIIARARKASP